MQGDHYGQKHCRVRSPEFRCNWISALVIPFSAVFVASKQRQWQVFRKRLGQDYVSEAFSEVVDEVVEFLSPLIAAEAVDQLRKVWYPPGPWSH